MAVSATVVGLALGCRHTQPQPPAENSVGANQPAIDVPAQRFASIPDETLTGSKPPELAQIRPERIDVLPTPPNGINVAELPPPPSTVEQPAPTVARAPINFGEPPAAKINPTASMPSPKEVVATTTVTPVKIALTPMTAPAPTPTVAATARVPVASAPAPVAVPSAKPVVAPTIMATSAPVAAPVTTPSPTQTPVAVPIITTGAAVTPTAAATPSVVTAPAVTTATSTTAPTASAPQEGAAPQYYNSPDYSILFGVLDYNARRGIWRLRFADAGDEDRYGGCVTLDGVSRQMDGYTSGQFVRVEGALVDSSSRAISPDYRVKAMRPANGK
jgi:hypothetical protein